MMYLAWLVILLSPYWLGPIVVWLTQKAGARPVFEPFTPGRHGVPADVATAFQQTCEALTTEGFHVVADLYQTGQVKHVSTRVALLENPATAELALAVAMFTAARPTPLVASYAELPTKLHDGRTVSVHNSPLPGSFRPPPSRVVVPLPIVRDPARLCRIKRAYVDRHYRGVERVPFDHQDDPARFLAGAMVRELTEQVEPGAWRRDNRAGVFRPRFTSAWVRRSRSRCSWSCDSAPARSGLRGPSLATLSCGTRSPTPCARSSDSPARAPCHCSAPTRSTADVARKDSP